MSNNLRILITSSLNVGKSVGEINKAIKEISAHKSLQKIKIKLDIDNKILQTLSNFNKNLNQITRANQAQSKSTNESTKSIKQETDAIKAATDAQKKWNTEKKVTTSTGGQVTGTKVTYGNNLNNDKQTVSYAGNTNDPTKIVDTENAKKDLADWNRMLNQAYKMNADYDKKTEALDRAHFEALRSNRQRMEAMDKAHYLALDMNRKRDLTNQQQIQRNKEQLLAMQNKAELQVMNLSRRYGSNVNNAGLQSLLNQIKALTPAMSNFKSEATRLTNEINKIGASAQASSGHTLNLGEAIRLTATRLASFGVVGMGFMKAMSFFRDGVQYVNEMNKALTQLSIVYMQSQEQVSKYVQVFSTMGKEMGILSSEIALGAVEFARQGLSEAEMLDKMSTAVQYAKISNIDFATSAKILTASVNSMGVSAERASDVFSYLGDATASGKLCA